MKLLPHIWNAPALLSKKIQATLHLTGYGVHILLFALAFLYPIVLVLSQRYPALISLFGIAFIFNATAFAPTLFFVIAQQQLGRRWWQALPAILFATALGAGMMVNTMRAGLDIFFKPNPVYERTPKFGIERKKQDWLQRRYQLNLDPIVFFEIALALVNVGTAAFAVSLSNWSIAVYSSLFSIGLLFTSGLTIVQTVAVRRNQMFSIQSGFGAEQAS